MSHLNAKKGKTNEMEEKKAASTYTHLTRILMAMLCAVCKVFETKSRVTRSYRNSVGNFNIHNINQGEHGKWQRECETKMGIATKERTAE